MSVGRTVHRPSCRNSVAPGSRATVTVPGEEHYGYVSEVDAAFPLAAGLDTFTDAFEDFIAESRFAWVQQRELRDRPWRD